MQRVEITLRWRFRYNISCLTSRRVLEWTISCLQTIQASSLPGKRGQTQWRGQNAQKLLGTKGLRYPSYPEMTDCSPFLAKCSRSTFEVSHLPLSSFQRAVVLEVDTACFRSELCNQGKHSPLQAVSRHQSSPTAQV